MPGNIIIHDHARDITHVCHGVENVADYLPTLFPHRMPDVMAAVGEIVYGLRTGVRYADAERYLAVSVTPMGGVL